jgi:Ni/Fe-hydrogenase subunit HybB-like protein
MPHSEYKRHKGKIITPSFLILLLLSLTGLALIALRFYKGLGAVSNMSDGYPWGIWIAYDVATGTAIACGGYAMAIYIYICNNMHYHHMIRSAVLTSMFGYCLAGFSVMVDLGRPWNAYNFFVPSQWQFNSAMFEVALCVMAYSTVLIIEILPSMLFILERDHWSSSNRLLNLLQKILSRQQKNTIIKYARMFRPKLDKVLIFFVVLGITLPTMHQSSLGSLMLLSSSKLHPLWYTGFLPLLFLLNCVFIGFSIMVLESIISCYAFKRPFETKELSVISGVIPWLTLIWFGVIFGDLVWRNQLDLIFSSGRNSFFFLLQNGLVAIGSFMLLFQRNRQSLRRLFLAAMALVAGGALYRFNVYLIGFDPGAGWSYFPSLTEFMVTVGLISIEILGYQLMVKTFPILPRLHHDGHPDNEIRSVI